ncbi:MAG TPA: peptide chain release factor N(5)-glutamine methyltransferase [Rhizomicrobium sp.]|nr:peptide chain release factor N(5)-glutamine methyltransferase [Rhizomicrobium sp.]
MTALSEALARGAKALSDAGVDSPRAEARILLADAMGLAPSQLIGGAAPTKAQLGRFDQAIARRRAGEPVAYITGKKEFWSLEFDVGPGVLVPRPETETLVEEILRLFPDRSARLRIADCGTGSGAILLALLKEFPVAAGAGVDSSGAALEIARRNARKFGLQARATFELGDWSSLEGRFDVIASNPPYLRPEEVGVELAFEPRQALVGGGDGLDAYRALAPLIAARLTPAGTAFLEIGQGQGEAVRAILSGAGLETVRIVPDLSGIPRCVVATVNGSDRKALGPEKALGMGGPSL